MTFQPGIFFWSATSPALGPDKSPSKSPWPGSTLSPLQMLCHCFPLTALQWPPWSQIPGVSRPLQAEQCSLSSRGQCISLHMPVWIRLISTIIQVRCGSAHLWAPQLAPLAAHSLLSKYWGVSLHHTKGEHQREQMKWLCRDLWRFSNAESGAQEKVQRLIWLHC